MKETLQSRFTRLFGRILAGTLMIIGAVLVAVGCALALVALVIDIETFWSGAPILQTLFERLLVAVFLVFSGLLAGGPFLVSGQLLYVLMSQRDLLASIDARLAALEQRAGAGRLGAERVDAERRP